MQRWCRAVGQKTTTRSSQCIFLGVQWTWGSRNKGADNNNHIIAHTTLFRVHSVWCESVDLEPFLFCMGDDVIKTFEVSPGPAMVGKLSFICLAWGSLVFTHFLVPDKAVLLQIGTGLVALGGKVKWCGHNRSWKQSARTVKEILWSSGGCGMGFHTTEMSTAQLTVLTSDNDGWQWAVCCREHFWSSIFTSDSTISFVEERHTPLHPTKHPFFSCSYTHLLFHCIFIQANLCPWVLAYSTLSDMGCKCRIAEEAAREVLLLLVIELLETLSLVLGVD